jgi:P4 family phage/plasmid primase-like protien
MSIIQNFLNSHKVQKGSEFTHTSMGKSAGAYYIPGDKQDDFFELYSTALENGEELHITEKHRDISPMVIDLDFRQQVQDRLYTGDMIITFLKALKHQIHEYVDIKDTTFYVMEKGIEARADKKEGQYKDGLHIVVPNVITTPEVQYIIRENIINNHMESIFGSTFTNKYDDIYDEAVIQRNNWFMYGSNKPDEENAWVVSKVFDASLNEIDNTHTDQELVELLSIRNKFDASKIKADKVDEIKEWKAKHEKPKKNDDEEQRVVRQLPSDCETVVKLVKLLNTTRAANYFEWINVGICLHNINEDLLDVWVEFSKQSTKYQDGECDKKWMTFTHKADGLSEGTLRHWARKDDPEGYKKVINESIKDIIYNSRSGTHTDVAKVVYQLYQDVFACCFINDKPYWYEFKGHRWVECPNAVSLKQHLSNSVSRAYASLAAEYHAKGSASENDTEQAMYCEIGKKLAKVSMQLKNAPFKANIIKECQEVFNVSKKDFYDKLDENKYLLGFDNGVYDLESSVFRDGMPSDYLTFTCGYDYTEKVNKEIREMINRFMWSIFEDKEMVDYLWNTTAYSLCGDKYLEMFEFYTGSGANAKGTLGKLLKNSFGEYYYEPSVTVFTCKKTSSSSANPELAKTKGKRFILASEPEETDKFQVGALKSWTGGDLIQARELYKSNIEFICQFKIAIQMNNKPKLSNLDGGIARRIIIVYFPFKFVDNPVLPNERKGDNTLKTRFETDKVIAQQFMMMLIERYNEHIKGNKIFPIPNKVKEATQQYLDDNNKVKKFLNDFVEITGKDDDMVLSKHMYDNVFKMSEYYERENDMKWFAEKMEMNGYPSVRDNCRKSTYFARKVFKGMKLKAVECEIKEDDLD